MYKVYLKPGKEESLKRFHPWIFSGAIARFDGEPEEGEVVEVYTSKKEFIAEGHFQIGSIAIRVLSFKQEPINHDFWKRKLEIAYDMPPIVWYMVKVTICPAWSLIYMLKQLSCRHILPVCTLTAWLSPKLCLRLWKVK